MLKTLSARSLIALLAIGMSGQPRKVPSRENNVTEEQTNPVVSMDSHNTYNYPQQAYAKIQEEPVRWYTSLKRPEWWLVGLGFLTLGFVGWQAWETRKAAEATKDSVNAAYGSVRFAEAQWELMKEKERARLDLDGRHARLNVESVGQDIMDLTVNLKVRNIGGSRAFIKRSHGKMITTLPDEVLNVEFDGQNSLDFPDLYIDPTTPTIEISIYLFPYDINIDTFAKSLENEKFTLHFFGFVEYETLGLCWRKDFRYEWVPNDSNSLGAMVFGALGGSAPVTGKDRLSNGYWSQRQDNSEYPVSCH